LPPQGDPLSHLTPRLSFASSPTNPAHEFNIFSIHFHSNVRTPSLPHSSHVSSLPRACVFRSLHASSLHIPFSQQGPCIVPHPARHVNALLPPVFLLSKPLLPKRALVLCCVMPLIKPLHLDALCNPLGGKQRRRPCSQPHRAYVLIHTLFFTLFQFALDCVQMGAMVVAVCCLVSHAAAAVTVRFSTASLAFSLPTTSSTASDTRHRQQQRFSRRA
jgi:hypothetical protein